MTEEYSDRLAHLHELAEELRRGVRGCNQPLHEDYPTASMESFADTIGELDGIETYDDRQTLIYALDKLRKSRDSVRDGPLDIKRLHNELFAEIDGLLNALPQQELVQLGPELNEPSLVVKHEEISSKLKALERRIDLAAEAGRQSVFQIDQSKKIEFNLFRIDLEALVKNAATIKTEISGNLVDLRWLTTLSNRMWEIGRSLSDGINRSRDLLGQFTDIGTSLRSVRELSRRAANGARILIQFIRRRWQSRGSVQKPFEIFKDIDAPWCPEMVMLPAGRFMMGSPESEEISLDNEGPQFEVTIRRPFALGRHLVTWYQYRYFCSKTGRDTPRYSENRQDDTPVHDVRYLDAEAYCAWLSEITGQDYGLPSEAQWEYACRAGTTTPYSFGTEPNYDLDFLRGPNQWGLHSMHWNYREWCRGWYYDNYEGAPKDERVWLGPASGLRILRGGTDRLGDECVHSAVRDLAFDDDSNGDGRLGFRCARF